MDNTASINDQELIIDLDKLNSTQSLGAEEYIRKDIIKDIVDKIDRTVKSNIDNIGRRGTSFNSASLPIAQHPCFFIHGERGSGKSTLLRGIIEALNNENRFGLTRSNPQKIELLTYVDPTEFAKGENFFIYILSKIADRLKEQKKASAHAYDSPYSFQDKRKEKHKKIIELFQDMAEGLKFIQDTNESLHKSEDAAFFFEDYVSKCSSSAQLKQKFAELLDEMCVLEDVDAYVVAIDDADINFGKCSEIMETVRNYMIAPRLVILFAGDMRLFSTVARGTHMEHFSAASLQHDESRKSHRDTIIEQLEDQYLMKLFPVNNRVYIGNFEDMIKMAAPEKTILLYSLTTKDKTRPQALELNTFIADSINTLVPSEFYHLVEDIFCSLSLRSILQLIDYWIKNAYFVDKKNNGAFNHQKLAKGLLMTFSQILISKQINYTAINQGNFPSLLKETALHAEGLNHSRENSSLLPFYGDESSQKISLYLSAELLSQLSNPSHQLRYIFYLHPLLHSIAKESPFRPESITKLYNTSSSYNYREWGGWCTARLWQSQTAKKPFNLGIIMMKNETKKGFISFEIFVQNLCKRIPNSLFVYAIYHSLSIIVENGKFNYCLSIYNLITLIHEILSLKHSNKEKLKDDIKRIIKIKETFPLVRNEPRASRSRPDLEDETDMEITYTSELHPYFETYEKVSAKTDEIVRKIVSWYNKYHNTTSLCYPQILDQCWINFYNKTLRYTEDARLHSNEDDKLAKAGQLLSNYMNALTDTLEKTCSNTNLHECIKTFPLWEVIISEKSSNYTRYLDIINIGSDTPNHLDIDIEEFKNSRKIYDCLIQATQVINKINELISGIKMRRSNESVRSLLSSKISMENLTEERKKKQSISKNIKNILDLLNNTVSLMRNLHELSLLNATPEEDHHTIQTNLKTICKELDYFNYCETAVKEINRDAFSYPTRINSVLFELSEPCIRIHNIKEELIELI